MTTHLIQKKFVGSKHFEFIRNLYCKCDGVQGLYGIQIKTSGIFWGVGTLMLLKRSLLPDNERKIKELETNILDFVESCKVIIDNEGTMVGYSQNVGLDANIVSTYYVILISLMIGKIDKIDSEKVSNWILSLQNEDGSFNSDGYVETDVRFVYCALSSLTILDKLGKINIERTLLYILRCYNEDGGFGCSPCSESHAAYTFCCASSLSLLNSLDLVDTERLGIWLCDRQLLCGGFNGRPEKAPDVCYSWWIFSVLFVLNKTELIDKVMLEKYILDSQDIVGGGISDRPGNIPDIFHTFFGITALSLMKTDTNLDPINPIFAIPLSNLDFLNLD
ncbi:Rab geranylgeranyl transferase beta / prenyltransferase [Cryptosporidium ryanae]|uniref:Rab geranylgeranyl transferase beta / prenyltransferase n=1 Tax=Cryptosporidium ryanae TaxID=515981 RepID=UPI00351A382C|nr:Rab geranylgeranyl transferase beta / prenyltransferase [Cryptosporidium ryanae]